MHGVFEVLQISNLSQEIFGINFDLLKIFLRWKSLLNFKEDALDDLYF